MPGRSFSALAALALVAIASQPAHAKQRDVYYGVTVLDPVAEKATPNSYVVVAGGRIVAIGRGRPSAKPGDRLHDFSGLWALPGLIDTHAHLTLGPVSIAMTDGKPSARSNPTDAITEFNAKLMLSFGVTTIRNPGAAAALNIRYDQQLADGRVLGPEMVWAGEIIDRAPFAIGNLVTLASPEQSVSQIVGTQSGKGGKFVKLYTGLSEAELAEGIASAHARGLRVIGHLSDVSWTRAAELGIDSITHIIPGSPDLLARDRRADYLAKRRPGAFQFFEWYEVADLDGPEISEMIKTLAKHRVHFDATLIAFEPAFFGDNPAMLTRDQAYYHPDMLVTWQKWFRMDAGWSAKDHLRAQKVWPDMLKLTRMMYEGGIPMTIGTDQSNPFIAPGKSVSREMALHQQAGIPAWAILRMATSDAARFLGMAKRTGRLRRGLEADIVFIGGDPRSDLNKVSDVRWVVNNGQLLDPSALRSNPEGV